MAWKWDNSEKHITMPVDFCRDTEIFDLSYPNIPEKKEKMRDPASGQAFWQWPGSDDRQFVVPVDVYHYLPKNGNLMRDIIGYISQQYMDTKDPVIETTFRQIADGIGLSMNGRRAQEIYDALVYAQGLRVVNQKIRRMYNGKEIGETVTFNFISNITRTDEINGEQIPPNFVRTKIEVNHIYADMLNNYRGPKAPIPVSALQKANQSPARQITPAKNLIYRLAARVPQPQVEYLPGTLSQILGYKTTRKDRLRRSINNTIEILYPIMISDYTISSDGKYIITLAGKLKK